MRPLFTIRPLAPKLLPATAMYLLPKDILILTYAILIGASPLIPVPLLDDWVADSLLRRLVADLARSYGLTLTEAEIQALAGRKKAGCAGGCLSALIFPFKAMLRQILFWREIGRGVDLATHTYYFSILLAEVLERGWYDPARAAEIKAVIERATAGANTKLVRDVFARTFNSSKGIVRATGLWLFRFGVFALKRFIGSLFARIRRWLRPVDSLALYFDLDQYLETARPPISVLLAELLDHLEQGIGQIPAEHFTSLLARFDAELQQAGFGAPAAAVVAAE